MASVHMQVGCDTGRSLCHIITLIRGDLWGWRALCGTNWSVIAFWKAMAGTYTRRRMQQECHLDVRALTSCKQRVCSWITVVVAASSPRRAGCFEVASQTNPITLETVLIALGRTQEWNWTDARIEVNSTQSHQSRHLPPNKCYLNTECQKT